MKKFLISENGNFYKANLHCHSTLSDARMTPEEIKAHYMEHGYSIVAYTDHDIFLTHPELCDENFLALNGFEVEITEEGKPWIESKTCHVCFVALDENIDKHPLWHRTKYLFCNAVNHRDEVKFDESKPDYERTYTPECVTDMMRIGRENNFFVTYNHPRWSLETYNDYTNYDNMHAMEIYNHSCIVGGYHEYDSVVYDEMLRAGKRIYCIATDDNHSSKDTCGGYIMIKSEALTYRDVADALKNGDFYASTGAEITSLWYENGKIHVTFPSAERVILSTGTRKQKHLMAPDGDPLAWNEAVFELKGEEKYVRITVFDKGGKTADTNAYFLDELNG